MSDDLGATPRSAEVTIPTTAGDPQLDGTLGRFAITRMLGRGGMGIVLAARDPDLGRDVAIKLLTTVSSDPEARARLEREARAMAQLTHPNVVTVYEIGTIDEQRFIAMELVEGGTLRRWLEESPRTWREIVSMFDQAGRGLVAAHAAGLVHRDFKPDNVLVGVDGRPRVGDFGLVSAVRGTGSSLSGNGMTEQGAVMGTPGYMSPEQLAGEVADARSDQFSYAVALFEALHGRRPFAGTTTNELHDAMRAGPRAPERKKAPPWVDAAVARALSIDPSERWSSMEELLAALRRDPGARRRRIVAGSAIVALVGVASWGLYHAARTPGDDPCAAVATRLSGVWDPQRRIAIRAHMIAVDPTRGVSRFEAAAAVLDRYAGDWIAMHVDACHAGRSAGARAGLYDRRVACLESRRSQVAAVVDSLATATSIASIDGAVVDAHRIADLAGCADANGLLADVPTPTPAIAALRAELAAAEESRVRGANTGEPERGLALLARARSADDPETLALALAHRSEIQALRAESEALLATERELVQIAARAHDDRLAVRAWTTLIFVISQLGKPDEAIALFPAAEAALAREGDDPALGALLLYREGGALDAGQDLVKGLARLDEARARLVRLGADKRGGLLEPLLSDVYLETADATSASGDHARGVELYKRSIELLTDAYGPEHPELRYPFNNMAVAYRWLGNYEESLSTAQRALAIEESRLGESLAMLPTLESSSLALVKLGRSDEAAAPLERAVAIARRFPDAKRELAGALSDLGDLEDGLERHDDALAHYTEALALIDQPGVQNSDIPNVLSNIGQIHLGQHRYAEAVQAFTRASSLTTAWKGPDTFTLTYFDGLLGITFVQAGRPTEAIAPLEHAVALQVPEDARMMQTNARFYLGRALFESGRDRRGGLAAARSAADELTALGSSNAEEAQAWIAKHR